MLTGTQARTRFAEELTGAVGESGLTQMEVAEAVGVRQSTVSSWMLGKVIPELATIQELARLLGRDEEQWTEYKLAALAHVRPRGRAAGGGEGTKVVPLPDDAAVSSDDVLSLSGLPEHDREFIRSTVARLKQLNGVDD